MRANAKLKKAVSGFANCCRRRDRRSRSFRSSLVVTDGLFAMLSKTCRTVRGLSKRDGGGGGGGAATFTIGEFRRAFLG